jgi:hypothetical protein
VEEEPVEGLVVVLGGFEVLSGMGEVQAEGITVEEGPPLGVGKTKYVGFAGVLLGVHRLLG